MITLKQVDSCFYWDYCQLMPSGILISSMFSENWLRVMKIFSIVSRLIWPTVGRDNMKQLSKISKTLSLSEMVSHRAGLSIFWHWTVPSQPHWPLLVLTPCRDFNVIKTLDIVSPSPHQQSLQALQGQSLHSSSHRLGREIWCNGSAIN